jgi:hypothetical protein
MKPNGDYESKLWKVVEKEGLADLSQYHRDGYFDEAPLYSRFKDVAFLREFGSEQADAALLRFALKFLKALIWYEIPEQPFLAALTIWNNPDDELIVPNLFVCSGIVQKWVGDNLALHPAKAAGSKRIEKLLSRLHMVEPFQALEDSSTELDMTRVFIGYSIPPYPNVVPLHALAKGVVSSRQRT